MNWFIRLLSLFNPKQVSKVPQEVPKVPQYKTPRCKEEYDELDNQNIDLYNLSQDIVVYSQTMFNVTPVITMIYRYQKEQEALYVGNKAYQEAPFKSPHQFWHAIDLRHSVYSQAQIIQLLEYVNTKYNPSNYYSWTLKCHEVSNNGMHLHLQFVKK